MIRKKYISTRRGGGLISSLVNAPKELISTVKHVVDIPKTLVGVAVNKAIDYLPVELHIPGYQYCGPGTKLEERLKRGDPGINPLDSACKEHDIAYSNNSDSVNRAVADRILAEKAWDRVKSSDASLAEKTAAWTVANIMKLKSKFGGRLKRRNYRSQQRKIGRGAYLEPYRSRTTGCGLNKKKKRRHRRRRPQNRNFY